MVRTGQESGINRGGEHANAMNNRNTVNWRHSDHFTWHEGRCKCLGKHCQGGTWRWETIVLLERFRANLSEFAGENFPLFVTSGCRCEQWNKRFAATTTGTHVEGRAADVVPVKLVIDRRDFFRIAHETNPEGGVGFYWSWDAPRKKDWGGVHLDTRHSAPGRRWHETDQAGVVKTGFRADWI